MKPGLSPSVTLLVVLIFAASLTETSIAQTNSAAELTGLWQANRRFGPDIRGTLLLKQAGSNWQAEIAAQASSVSVSGDDVTFELPGGQGSFQGRLAPDHAKIAGFWIQPKTVESGNRYASPVTITKQQENIWSGEVSPLDDVMTLYLLVKPRDNGSVGVLLRNPERNFGKFVRVDHIEREDENVKLYGTNSATANGNVLAEGKYYRERDVLSIFFPAAGGTFDFKRVGTNQPSDFYARGFPTVRYTYAPPPALDDGWQTASVEDVGISRAGMEKFIQTIIDQRVTFPGAPEIHGVLIARHGKLVLEEYFHGENRDKPHDTRSAAKSLTATLFGAAVKAGIPVNVSNPVYQVMNGGTFPPGLEARKRAVTVEHLLTMSSGLDCEDDDPKAAGNEGAMESQTAEPDYYKYTLALKMVHDPGERAIYGSASPNLVGGVLQRASGQPLTVLFQNLLADPLQIKKYYLNLTPTGDAYMGGGVRLLGRDFLKLGQLHLNGGSWKGREILTPEWSQRATSHLVNLEKSPVFDWEKKRLVVGNRMYGYCWWLEDYPFKGRKLRAFLAAGNGGQYVIGIPELDLVAAFFAGNYSEGALYVPMWTYVPQNILTSIDN